jgi:hypothetical protein
LWQHYAKLKRQRRIDRWNDLWPRRAMSRIPSLLVIRKPGDIGFVQGNRSGLGRGRAVAGLRTSFERSDEWHW